MFTPMALTVLMALAGAALLSVTFVPAAVALVVTGKVSEHENAIMRAAKRIYLPLLARAIRFRRTVAFLAVLIVIASSAAATRMGFEFISSLDEGDLAITATRIPGTSLTQSLDMQAAPDRRVKRIPEVENFFTRTGTAEVATDPMPPSTSDGFVMLKPRVDCLERRLSFLGAQ
jgi:cobalt-zinc-cadmium resistance protein CzcA